MLVEIAWYVYDNIHTHEGFFLNIFSRTLFWCMIAGYVFSSILNWKGLFYLCSINFLSWQGYGEICVRIYSYSWGVILSFLVNLIPKDDCGICVWRYSYLKGYFFLYLQTLSWGMTVRYVFGGIFIWEGLFCLYSQILSWRMIARNVFGGILIWEEYFIFFAYWTLFWRIILGYAFGCIHSTRLSKP